MSFKRFLAATAAAAVLTLGAGVSAQEGALPAVDVELVADGFVRPLLVTDARDGSGRMFVVEQGGRIWVLQNGERLETPFIDLSARISPEANQNFYTERGLLGFAFSPDFAESGRVYLSFTGPDGSSVIERYLVSADNPNVVDVSTAQTLFTMQQPYANHNGGHLAFGPDGYLYVGFGDGGSQGDPQNNAQNLNVWLGKLLRLDVSSDEAGYTIPVDNPFAIDSDAAPEIWAYGLRNPWRFSFDMTTGDLYIADVGGSSYEEVNFQPADAAGGQNYGWKAWEGLHQTGMLPDPGNAVPPIAEYDHSQGISISGGYVYRGENFPTLDGIYFYGDFGFGRLWGAMQMDDGTWVSEALTVLSGRSISSFGQDENGEVYVVDYNGAILRLIPA
ncbi:MAG: PQQ-dependent sugar dehydrogenase [Pleurocapsa minor GSE-CHR-MK-17-07R]|jgi:glucose/arabinose dehydrogenase|nr:PQQ-dependent sugar dehydrogenase [Pleurocapsa minor GSE-CHR-MK 17-07R]